MPPSHLDVVDAPRTSLDHLTEMSGTFLVAGHSVNPLVTTNELIAHLGLLLAFHKLRTQVEGEDIHLGLDSATLWARYIEHAVERFDVWARSLEGRSRKAAFSNIDIGVLLVWHAYLLNPHSYTQDSLTVYPALTLIGAFPLDLTTAQACKRPFSTSSIFDVCRFECPASINLVHAVLRQGSFIEKMVQLGWADHPSQTLLLNSIARYHSFLDLIASRTVASVVPTLDIDLAWHTHQLQGSVYRLSTKKLLGFFLNHDDSIPEESLEVSYNATSKAWKDRFNELYRPGSTVAGCGSGGCNGSCGNMAGCGGGCNGECGSCGSRINSAGCSGSCSGKCGTAIPNIAGCSSGGCSGECGMAAISPS